MVDINKIINLIFKVADEINEILPQEKRVKRSLETVLFGSTGVLDSLGITIFIVALEQKIEEEFGILVSITDKGMIPQGDGLSWKIEALAEHISLLLGGEKSG